MKINQDQYGILEIDNSEKVDDIVKIWMEEKETNGSTNTEVVFIHRKNIDLVIKELEKCRR